MAETMWYSARLLYESVAVEQGRDNDPLFEEKLIVFIAGENDDIVTKVTSLAKRDEIQYENALGYDIRWEFREILEVQEIMSEAIEEGTEVFFRFWHDPTARDFQSMRQTHGDKWWIDENSHA